MDDLRYNNTLFIKKQMMRDNLLLDRVGLAPLFILNDELSHSLGKGKGHSDLEKSIRNTDEPTIHIYKEPLFLPPTEHIKNIDNVCKQENKRAILHKNTETHTEELSKLFARINMQHSFIDANNEDLDVAFSYAESCQLVILNERTLLHLDEIFAGISGAVGYIIARSPIDESTYNGITKQVWKHYPNIVSIGFVVDPFIESEYELHLLIFRGENTDHTNVVTALPEYIAIEEIDDNLHQCAKAHFTGTERCLFHEEMHAKAQLIWSDKLKAYICEDCAETDMN
jgi:hypothetical protein